MLPQWSSLFTHLLLPVDVAVQGGDGKQDTDAQHLIPGSYCASQVRSIVLDSLSIDTRKQQLQWSVAAAAAAACSANADDS